MSQVAPAATQPKIPEPPPEPAIEPIPPAEVNPEDARLAGIDYSSQDFSALGQKDPEDTFAQWHGLIDRVGEILSGPGDTQPPAIQGYTSDSASQGAAQTLTDTLAGMTYMESSGVPGASTTNKDLTQDIGLLQISQERFQQEVLPWAKQNLSAAQQQQLSNLLGIGSLDQINVADTKNNPDQGFVAGALEFTKKMQEVGQWLKENKPGEVVSTEKRIDMALRYYNSGNITMNTGDHEGVGRSDYVERVTEYAKIYHALYPDQPA